MQTIIYDNLFLFSLHTTKVFLEHGQIFMVDLFAKKVNS